jgi:hypothetical protein
MELLIPSSNASRSALEIFESVNKSEQERLLRVLKLEKARLLAKKLDKKKHPSKLTYKQIDEAVTKVRKTYAAK